MYRVRCRDGLGLEQEISARRRKESPVTPCSRIVSERARLGKRLCSPGRDPAAAVKDSEEAVVVL